MADYAERPATARIPRLLKEAFLSQQWGLPHAGGWADAGNWPQSEKMAKVLNLYEAVKAWRNAKNVVQWSEANPHQWSIVQNLIVARKAYGLNKQAENHSGR